MRGGRLSPVLLVLVGYALCFAAWPLSDPPFAAPDEPAHYLRAVDVGGGHIGGEIAFRVPAGLWGRWYGNDAPNCNAFDATLPATCVDRVSTLAIATPVTTPAGQYLPLPYILPGLALRLGNGPNWHDRIARLVSLLPCLALIALAVLVLWDSRSRLSLLGVVLAVTPMVVFIGTSLTPSGLEIASGLAFGALLLRLTREGPPPQRAWTLVAIVGCVLALSRTTGAVWVILDGAVVAIFAGRARLRELLRPRRAKAALATVAFGVALNRVWEAVYGSTLTQSGVQSSSIVHWLPHGARQLPRLFRESIGLFGWLDTWLPTPVYDVWFVLGVALLAVALAVGTRRQRIALVVLLAADALAATLLSASLEASTGYDIQGRHVLGFTVLTPLLGGEILFRNRDRLGRAASGVFAVAALAAAATQLIGLLSNARRQGVGVGHSWFAVFRSPAWSPPLGWAPWIAVGAAGAVALAAAAYSPRR